MKPRRQPWSDTGRAPAGRSRVAPLLFAALLLIAMPAAVGTIALIVANAAEYGLARVPVASWLVLGLAGLLLAVAGTGAYSWAGWRKTQRHLAETARELADLQSRPIEDAIPAVVGHRQLSHAEPVALLQVLFRRPPDVRYVHVAPLSGGFGGSTVLLARLQLEQGGIDPARTFVVKVGVPSDMAGEQSKFHQYVLPARVQAPAFFRHAVWGDWSAIAYKFAGLDPNGEVQSLDHVYRSYATPELVRLMVAIYGHLEQAWYEHGQVERTDLYAEYHLLGQKAAAIAGHVARLADETDPYRLNLGALEEELQPNLRPAFCPDATIPWSDPVAFVRTWTGRSLTVPVHRATVHGDLNARNVLVEIGADLQKQVWFIDFSHTGAGLSEERTAEALVAGRLSAGDKGHTLRDFSRMEADLKFILTRLADGDDLRQAIAFERALLGAGLALPAEPPSGTIPFDERFQKAWLVIGELRRRAAAYLVNPDDLRPYYFALLQSTLPIVYYHPDQFESRACERQQKRYALIAAGMLCHEL